MRTTALVVLLVAAVPMRSSGQSNQLSSFTRFQHEVMKTMLLGAAEKMPEEKYGFRPAEPVRSFGQIIGHVADGHYLYCSAVRGEKNPAPQIERSRRTKSELIAGLKDAFGYCDPAYSALTDASAGEIIKAPWGDTPKLGLLTSNLLHNASMYGNLVTYLRLNNIVPPTSEPDFQQRVRGIRR